MHFSGDDVGSIQAASYASISGEDGRGMGEHLHTRGDEKFSLGNTAPYRATASRICVSNSGNANVRCSSSSESLAYPLPSSSSDRVLSAGLQAVSGEGR